MKELFLTLGKKKCFSEILNSGFLEIICQLENNLVNQFKSHYSHVKEFMGNRSIQSSVILYKHDKKTSIHNIWYIIQTKKAEHLQENFKLRYSIALKWHPNYKYIQSAVVSTPSNRLKVM